MIYGQYQYYLDELDRWSLSIAFHKGELRESVRQLGVLGDQIVSSANIKANDSFTDRLMVQEQQFDHITNQIIGQQQRLEQTVSLHSPRMGTPFVHQQNSLRSRMKNAEWHFVRTKYACSNFLSSFLSGRSLALQN